MAAMKFRFLMLLTLTLSVTQKSFAADHSNLEEGLPISIEDVYPIAYQGRELQGRVGFEKLSSSSDEEAFFIEPRVEYGIFRNSQISVLAPFYTEEIGERKSGRVEADFLYNFFTEPMLWPAVSVAGGAEFPTNKGSAGVDPHLKLILTKTLPPHLWFQRVHLNVMWKGISESEIGERKDLFSAVIGYSIRTTTNSMFLADIIWEEEAEEGMENKLAEVGSRIQLTPLTLAGIGVGFGLDNESTDFRVIASLQHELTCF